MIVEFYTKNFSLSDTIKIQTNFVPRVGESIIIKQNIKFCKFGDEFLIHNVTYTIENNKLIPLVQCHACNDPINNRRSILEETGWLQPTS